MDSLEIKNLDLSINDNTILKGINLKLDRGDFAIVAGPSGSGKTSLGSVINGIIPFYHKADLGGQFIYKDENITDMTIEQRSEFIGTVLQNPDDQIIFDNVGDELSFPMENAGLDGNSVQARVDDLAKILKLDKNAQTAVLSGGQKQKLITGSSLGTKKEILILDEPLANLDETSSKDLLEILGSLRDSGYIIILIEHRLDLCLDYGNKFVYLDGSARVFEEKLEFEKFYQSKKVDYPIYFKSDKSKDPIIQLEDISLTKNNKEILKDINLDIYQGDKINIVGDNGAGKTSLVSVMAGITRPSSGKVKYKFDNKNIFDKIGYILQNPNYQLFMPSVYEELTYKAVSKDMADFILESLDLKALKNAHPQSLSQGQKRRLAVGAILSSRPDILIFDEPTVGQDPKSLGKILDTIDQVYKDQVFTMVTISHDRDLRSNLGDRRVLIENGQIKSR